MKKLFSLILVFLLFSGSLLADDSRLAFYGGDFSSLKKKAADEGKLCFVEFYVFGCRPCKRIENETFTDPQVIRHIKNKYIPYKVDANGFMGEGFEIAKEYGVRIFPSILVLDTDGTVLKQMSGFFTAEELLATLKSFESAMEEFYAKTNFDSFEQLDLNEDFDSELSSLDVTSSAVEEIEESMPMIDIVASSQPSLLPAQTHVPGFSFETASKATGALRSAFYCVDTSPVIIKENEYLLILRSDDENIKNCKPNFWARMKGWFKTGDNTK